MEKEAKGKVNTVQIQYYQSPCGKLILGSFENKTLYVRLGGE